MNDNKKRALMYTIIGVATLIVLVVGATYAYFRIGVFGDGSNTIITATTPKGSNIAIQQLESNFYLKLSASDMSLANGGAEYYAAADKSKKYETTEEKGTHDILEVSVVGDGIYNCTGEIVIELDTSKGSMGSVLEAGDMKLRIISSSLDTIIDLSDLLLEEEKGTIKYPIDFDIGGTEKLKETIYTYVKLINKSTTKQNHLAGKELKVDITTQGINCELNEAPKEFTFYIGGSDNPEYTNTETPKTYISWKENDIKDYCVTDKDDAGTCSWKDVIKKNSVMLMALNYSVEDTYALTKGDREYTLYAFLRDKYGQVSASVSDSITLDQTIEGISTVEVESNDGYTRSNTVRVSAEWTDNDIVSYCISEEEDAEKCISWTANEITNKRINNASYTFTNEKEERKTIYVHIKDRAGNTSSKSDTIIYDKTAPAVGEFNFTSGKVNPTNSIRYTNETTLGMYIKWNTSDVKYYCIKDTNEKPSESDNCWKSVGSAGATTVSPSVTIGTTETSYTKYAFLKDGAGNISGVTNNSASITYDKTPPTITVTGPTPSKIKQGQTATYTLTMSETVSQVTGKTLSISPVGVGTVSLSSGSGTSFTITVTGGSVDGAVTITIPAGMFQDTAGNTSAVRALTGITVSNSTGGDAVLATNPVGTNGLWASTVSNDQLAYRFQGPSANNYICLKMNGNSCASDYMFRIIGIVGADSSSTLVSKGDLKVIKNTPIGSKQHWHTTDSGHTSWTNSSLKAYLNNSWYNSYKVNLSEKVRSLIKLVNWYSAKMDSVSTWGGTLYEYENETYREYPAGGYVGLMQVSDFYLSVGDTVNCLNNNDCGCRATWMVKCSPSGSIDFEYTISSHYFDNLNETYVWYTTYSALESRGGVSYQSVNYTPNYVRPVFYLDVSTVLEGKGTEGEPFIVQN